MKFALTALMLLLAARPASANDKCDGLAPTNAQDVTNEFKGKIEGKINGIISRLAGGTGSIDGEYRNLVTDELKHYPNADKVYVWQRLIYLACIRPDVKIDVNHLFELYLKGPSQAAGLPRASPRNGRTNQPPPQQTPTHTQTNTTTIFGSNNNQTTIIDGSRNTVTNSTSEKQ